MAQVYGAGGKTRPKKGRLGTGSYYPDGTPLYHHPGTVFPGINVEQPQFPQIMFGEPSRAGIATVVAQGRVQSQPLHPNKSQYNNATQVKQPPAQTGSSGDYTFLQLVPPKANVLKMPHERNTNSASGTHKKPNVYRSAFGASRTMPTDTAFKRNPDANYKRRKGPKPKNAIEAVKKSAPERTFARAHNPLPVSGGVNQEQQNRVPVPSFISRGNRWFDANNSFIAGHNTPAGQGVGRWHIVKKGVV